MKQKFDNIIKLYFGKDIKAFRAEVQKLNKSDLLRFCAHCYAYDYLDIFEIENIFNS